MRFLTFIFLALFSIQTYANPCDSLFTSPLREYLTEEFREFRGATLIDDLLTAGAKWAPPDVITKMRSILMKDPYMERVLAQPNANKIAEQILAKVTFPKYDYKFTSDRINARQIVETIIIDMLVARRERYFNLRDRTPITRDLPDTEVTNLDLIKIWTSQPKLKFSELMDIMPNLDLAWPKKFKPTAKDAPVNLFYVGLKDVPNTVVFVADDIGNLNFILDRVSAWVEANEFIQGQDMYGYKGAGHDLKAKDIKRYIDFVRKNPTAYVSDDPELQRRLNIEKEFVFKILEPMVIANPRLVLLAISTDNASKGTLSHEVIHAQFFVSKKLQRLATQFYLSHVEEAHKKIFMSDLPFYDFKNDYMLLINEFLAHMTQRDGATSMRMSYPTIADLFLRYEKPYMEFLEKNGYKLVR